MLGCLQTGMRLEGNIADSHRGQVNDSEVQKIALGCANADGSVNDIHL